MTRRGMLALLGARVDPAVVLDQSVTLDEGNFERLRGYVWTSEEKSESRGKVTRQQKFEINLVSGGLYWRKLEHNGKPLGGAEAEAERRRLESHLRNGVKTRVRREERDHLELLARAHSVKYLGEETIDGRANHVITTEPLKGNHMPLIAGLSYKLWIDQKELHWRRAEITFVKPVEWLLHQLDLGRICYPYSNQIVNTGKLGKGARQTVEMQRLEDGTWTLNRMRTEAGSFTNELRYSQYRRFASESQLLVDSDEPPR